MMTLAISNSTNLDTFKSEIQDLNDRDSWGSCDNQSITDISIEKIEEFINKNIELIARSKNDPTLQQLLLSLHTRILESKQLLGEKANDLALKINVCVLFHSFPKIAKMANGWLQKNCGLRIDQAASKEATQKKMIFSINTNHLVNHLSLNDLKKNTHTFNYKVIFDDEIDHCNSVEIHINNTENILPKKESLNLITLLSNKRAIGFCCIDLVNYLNDKFEKLHLFDENHWRVSLDDSDYQIGNVILLCESKNSKTTFKVDHIFQKISKCIHFAVYVGSDHSKESKIFMSLWGSSPLIFSNMQQMKDFYPSTNLTLKLFPHEDRETK